MKSSSMVSLVTDYLALRRGLGFDLVVQGWALLDFAKYADATGHHGPITTDLIQKPGPQNFHGLIFIF